MKFTVGIMISAMPTIHIVMLKGRDSLLLTYFLFPALPRRPTSTLSPHSTWPLRTGGLASVPRQLLN